MMDAKIQHAYNEIDAAVFGGDYYFEDEKEAELYRYCLRWLQLPSRIEKVEEEIEEIKERGWEDPDYNRVLIRAISKLERLKVTKHTLENL